MDLRQKYLDYKYRYLSAQQQSKQHSTSPQRLQDYYIVSSHNTYLTGDQLTSSSSYYYYLAVLNTFKGACLEIDPSGVTSDRNDILVYHYGASPTNTGVKLSVLLELIIAWTRLAHTRFDRRELGPIILTFDNKPLHQRWQHLIVWKIFFKTLYAKENSQYVVPYWESIPIENNFADYQGKIIVRWDECINGPCCDFSHKELVSQCSGKGLTGPCLKDKCPSNWITINKPKRDLLKNKVILRSLTMQTIKQGRKGVLEPKTHIKNATINQTLLNNLRQNLFRVFPDPLTTLDSSNYFIDKYALNGIQYIAMNMQHLDIYLILALSMFSITKGFFSSFQLKPDAIRNNRQTKDSVNRLDEVRSCYLRPIVEKNRNQVITFYGGLYKETMEINTRHQRSVLIHYSPFHPYIGVKIKVQGNSSLLGSIELPTSETQTEVLDVDIASYQLPNTYGFDNSVHYCCKTGNKEKLEQLLVTPKLWIKQHTDKVKILFTPVTSKKKLRLL